MIHHLALFRLRPDVSAAVISDLMAHFEALPAAIDAIQALETQRGTRDAAEAAHFGVLSRFADRQALHAYLAHPLYQAALQRVKDHLEQMLVLEYETDGDAGEGARAG
ncbi:Dabb family protein [Kallotenue papyrolyticum]|uniref:Dabb family protein n=1 Tax=Kallotenue papyrolyticum TaxID=1325125 RepID=UPI000492841B|nr:Dabb family protein [Kallotenue papyrolyticum]